MENSSSFTKVFKRDSPNKSYLGEKFGRLTVIADGGFRTLLSGEKKRLMICKCDCGVEKTLDLARIKKGNTKSCGCYNLEEIIKRNTTHGMKGTRFYSIYKDMNKRCKNKNCTNFHNYGGRGIKNEFSSFEHFRDIMFGTYSDNLTLERIDVNGNYSPENCKWITMVDQARNRRDTVRYNGEPLITYCEREGINYQRTTRRIHDGWDVERALKTPKKKHRYDNV